MKKLFSLAALPVAIIALAGCGGSSAPATLTGDQMASKLQQAISDQGGDGTVQSCVVVAEGAEYACVVGGTDDYGQWFSFRVNLNCDTVACQVSWDDGYGGTNGYTFNLDGSPSSDGSES